MKKIICLKKLCFIPKHFSKNSFNKNLINFSTIAFENSFANKEEMKETLKNISLIQNYYLEIKQDQNNDENIEKLINILTKDTLPNNFIIKNILEKKENFSTENNLKFLTKLIKIDQNLFFSLEKSSYFYLVKNYHLLETDFLNKILLKNYQKKLEFLKYDEFNENLLFLRENKQNLQLIIDKMNFPLEKITEYFISDFQINLQNSITILDNFVEIFPNKQNFCEKIFDKKLEYFLKNVEEGKLLEEISKKNLLFLINTFAKLKINNETLIKEFLGIVKENLEEFSFNFSVFCFFYNSIFQFNVEIDENIMIMLKNNIKNKIFNEENINFNDFLLILENYYEEFKEIFEKENLVKIFEKNSQFFEENKFGKILEIFHEGNYCKNFLLEKSKNFLILEKNQNFNENFLLILNFYSKNEENYNEILIENVKSTLKVEFFSGENFDFSKEISAKNILILHKISKNFTKNMKFEYENFFFYLCKNIENYCKIKFDQIYKNFPEDSLLIFLEFVLFFEKAKEKFKKKTFLDHFLKNAMKNTNLQELLQILEKLPGIYHSKELYMIFIENLKQNLKICVENNQLNLLGIQKLSKNLIKFPDFNKQLENKIKLSNELLEICKMMESFLINFFIENKSDKEIKLFQIEILLNIIDNFIRTNFGSITFFQIFEKFFEEKFNDLNEILKGKLIFIMGKINKCEDRFFYKIQKHYKNKKDYENAEILLETIYFFILKNYEKKDPDFIQNLLNKFLDFPVNFLKDFSKEKLLTFYEITIFFSNKNFEIPFFLPENLEKLKTLKDFFNIRDKANWENIKKINETAILYEEFLLFMKKKNFHFQIGSFYVQNSYFSPILISKSEKIFIIFSTENDFLNWKSKHMKGDFLLKLKILKQYKIKFKIIEFDKWISFKKRHEKNEYFRKKL